MYFYTIKVLYYNIVSIFKNESEISFKVKWGCKDKNHNMSPIMRITVFPYSHQSGCTIISSRAFTFLRVK